MRQTIKLFTAAIAILCAAMAAQAQKLSLTAETMVQTTENTAFVTETAKTYTDADGIDKTAALVKVQFPEDGLGFQGDIVSTEHHKQVGEYWIYMRAGAKALKITHPRYYSLNCKFGSLGIGALSSKTTYALTLKAKSGDVDFYEDNTRGLTLGLNYFPISINGPELALGYNFNHFMVEVAIAIGFNASDNLILDNTKVTRYGCNRFSLRLGYDLKIGRRFALQPQAALVRNYISADDVFFQLNEDLTKMENAEVYALGLGARLLWAPFGKTFRLHVTPHYSIRLAEKNWQPLADVDDTIKAYGEGFQLVAGLMLYF